MATHVEPSLGGDSYSCPHCGALAHQSWNRLGLHEFGRNQKPNVLSSKDVANVPHPKEEKEAERWASFVERIAKNSVTYWYVAYTSHDWEFVNLYASQCFSCKGFAVWVGDKIVYPVKDSSVPVHEMMPAEVKTDFEEAASIVDKSPRGAAALLRLCIQKIMPVLGEAGKNINTDIKELIKKGIDPDIAKALDILRVVGNESVHPGTMDLKDDKATALKLFDLVNIVVEKQIAGPARIAALFAGLPPEKLKEIEKRDKPKAIEDNSGGKTS